MKYYVLHYKCVVLIHTYFPDKNISKKSCNHTYKQLYLNHHPFVHDFTHICFPAIMCEEGKVYSPCGPACPNTCVPEQGISDTFCNRTQCIEGCFCPDGFYDHSECSFACSNSSDNSSRGSSNSTSNSSSAHLHVVITVIVVVEAAVIVLVITTVADVMRPIF